VTSPKLETQIKFILGKAGVQPADLEVCLRWAFGPDAWELAPYQWAKRWNKLHPSAFHLKGKEKFVETVFVVGYYFVQEKHRALVRSN